MLSERMSWALYVGRFQPFHKGHLQAIRGIMKREERLIILIGSSLSSHERENPFTLGERIEMILSALEEEGINRSKFLLAGVPDTDFHPSWVTYVEKSVPEFSPIYTNDPLTSRLFKEEGYDVQPVPLYQREKYSGTEIRRRILAEEDWRDLVPPSVYAIIKRIGGDSRIRDLDIADTIQKNFLMES